jgi:endonuclease YncB( thermonuclease family)
MMDKKGSDTHMPYLWKIALFCVVLVGPAAALADFTGQVVSVIDGDTVKLKLNGTTEEVRLYGVDCPERTRPFGRRAKQFTTSETLGKEVTVKTFGQDRHDRPFVEITLSDGRILNRELVKAGWCSDLLSAH